MRSLQELKERIRDYKGVEYAYTEFGYVAWQCSTGENYEILFIEVTHRRRGYGRELLRIMCERIRPYHSVFVVRLASNEEAGKFYRALGFQETHVPGLYKGDNAVIGVVPFSTLVEKLKG